MVTLRTDPWRYLIAPRLVASTLMLPVLDMVDSYRKVDDVTGAILLAFW